MEEEKKDYFARAIDEAKEHEAFYRQIVQELRTEERYKNYFSQFSPESVDRFIDHYATQKVNWYRYSSVMATWQKRKDEQWYEIARYLITAIQLVKVFQTIIRWGNYELPVPEARSYFDFMKWLANPFICPYIDAVQPHEIETAIGFIRSLDAAEQLKYIQLHYVSIHSLQSLGGPGFDDDLDDYPLFFRYWDQVYGTAYLRAKVPERIQKEHAYVDACRILLKQEQPPQKPAAPINLKAPLNHWERSVTDKFVAACETAEFRRMYKTHRWWQNCNEFSEVVEGLLSDLTGAPQYLPIESNDDWREAVAHTAEAFARQQVSECIPLAYQEYKEIRAKGGRYTGWVRDEDNRAHGPWYKKHLAQILEGRKLANEPADYNF